MKMCLSFFFPNACTTFNRYKLPTRLVQPGPVAADQSAPSGDGRRMSSRKIKPVRTLNIDEKFQFMFVSKASGAREAVGSGNESRSTSSNNGGDGGSDVGGSGNNGGVASGGGSGGDNSSDGAGGGDSGGESSGGDNGSDGEVGWCGNNGGDSSGGESGSESSSESSRESSSKSSSGSSQCVGE